ncbi:MULTISPECIES: hypothetical protein [unclassified Streptomyces]|uniref:hypothetical protein n=1 Tax=unclassified Streptomyces TaxID=2593676 RepID=UPI002E1140AD|nr:MULTISPECIES: hypothetical protein [unclassified Streptomyces]WSR09847.1 hypothetical protein OG265_29225 [Streptomyces sp. NBC_01208]WSR47429.1 hypothetical protein OG279_07275 [Streptomyces sp. NBC_01201]
MSAPTPRPGRLSRSPVVLRDGQWWLVSGAGSILATDPAFTSTLDDFATAVAAADQAVADLHARQNTPSGASAGGAR